MSFDEWTQKQAHRLAQAIAIHHDKADHSACLDALDAYITAQVDGQNYQALFPSVAQHLDSCVACAESYALVYEARVAEAADMATIPVPEPNLDFLRPNRAAMLQRKLAEAVERVAPRRVRFTLSQTLLDLLLPPQTPQLALRSAASEVPLFNVTVAPAADQIQIQVSIYQERESQDLCTVRSQVTVADREWPDLEGIPVALISSGAQRRATTDPWGEAVFAHVPKTALAGLQIEVAVDGPPQTST